MSDIPQMQVQYRLGGAGEMPHGRTVDIKDRPGGQAAILLHPQHTRQRLCDEFTRLCSHQIVHGVWRQRWTDDGRMRRPAQGLRLAVSRWETVPADMMPSGHIVVPAEEEGSCVWLIDERYCTHQLLGDMNDLLLRLAGDGLWIQQWFRGWPVLPGPTPGPLLAAPVSPLVTV